MSQEIKLQLGHRQSLVWHWPSVRPECCSVVIVRVLGWFAVNNSAPNATRFIGYGKFTEQSSGRNFCWKGKQKSKAIFTVWARLVSLLPLKLDHVQAPTLNICADTITHAERNNTKLSSATPCFDLNNLDSIPKQPIWATIAEKETKIKPIRKKKQQCLRRGSYPGGYPKAEQWTVSDTNL